MEDFDIFEEGYVEPKAEERAALIAELQSGDFTLSFSSLTAFAVSPAAFIAYKLQERKTTKAMLLGEVVHCKVLEPDYFEERYHVMPVVNAATVEGKKEWADVYTKFLKKELPVNKQGNPIIPKVDDIVAQIKEGTKKVDESGRIIFPGITVLPGTVVEEGSFRARKLISNRACRHVLNQIEYTEKRVKFDFCDLKFRGVIDGGGNGIIADLKNMPDATLENAQRAIWGRRLHWQAFGYDAAIGGGNRCHILAVDGNGETSVHAFSIRNLDSAERQMQKTCQAFKSCVVESLYDPEVWSMSQDFWLRTEMNPVGINYL